MINVFGLLLTLVIYKILFYIQKKILKKMSYINNKLLRFSLKILTKLPLIILTSAVIILILKIFTIEYDFYNKSAKFITYLLAPATIALAKPLVENIEVLTTNKRATYLGLLFSTTFAITSTYFLGKLFNADFNVIISMLPKSVTAPIAINISSSIGGIPELTACLVVFTGLLGLLTAHKILKLFKIKSDIAIGLSIGTATHVLGTTSCIARKKWKQVAVSTAGLIIVAILSGIFIPLFIKLFNYIN